MPDNSERNRALHELVKPGECFHDVESGACGVWSCVNCGFVPNELPYTNPDYFSPDIPHSQVVALVKAAVERFGRFDVGTQLMELTDEGGLHDNPNIDNSYMADFLSIAAPEIAEAIYNLIEAERTRVSEKVAAASKEMMEDGEEY